LLCAAITNAQTFPSLYPQKTSGSYNLQYQPVHADDILMTIPNRQEIYCPKKMTPAELDQWINKRTNSSTQTLSG